MLIDAFSVLCAQLTRDLLAIAKFLFILREVSFGHFFDVLSIISVRQYDQSEQLINVLYVITKV